jgi:hypothetical protein
VREIPAGSKVANDGLLPKGVIHTAVCAVDFGERVEVGETELDVIVIEETGNYFEDFEQEFGRQCVWGGSREFGW